HSLLDLDKDSLYSIFSHYFQSTIDDYETLDKILDYIDNHTYTIELLAKSAYTNEWSIKDLYEKLQEYGIDFDSKKVFYTDKTGKKKTAYEHLIEIFLTNELSQKEKEYMLVFSVLPPRELGHLTLANWLRLNEGQIDDFFNVLSELSNKGWLTRVRKEERIRDDMKGLTFQCHSIIQIAIKHHLQPNHKNCRVIVSSVFKLLATEASIEGMVLIKRLAIPFGEFILNTVYYDLEIDMAVYELISRFINLGESYGSTGDYHKFLDYSTKANRAYKDADLPDSWDSPEPTIKNNMGLAYALLGRFDESIDYLESAVSLLETNSKRDYKVLLSSSYNNLANSYRELGQFTKALETNEKALALRKELLPEEHPYLAQSYNAIGVDYMQMRDFERAQENLFTSLELRMKHLGKHHPDIGESHFNIGDLLDRTGKYEMAFYEYQLSLEIFKVNYEESHPLLVKCKVRLAEIYMHKDEFTEALELLKKAEQASLSVPGRALASIYAKMSHCYKSMSDLPLAKESLLKSIDESRIEVENNSVGFPLATLNIMIDFNNLADIFIIEADFQEAAVKYIEAISFGEKFLQNHKDEGGKIQKFLAELYQRLGLVLSPINPNKALEMLSKSLEAFKIVFINDTKELYKSFPDLEQLGGSFMNVQRPDLKAIVFETWIELEQGNSSYHMTRVKAIRNLAFSFQEMGNNEQSYTTFNQAIEVYNLYALNEEELLAELHNGAGVSLTFAEYYELAVDHYLISREIRERLFGEQGLVTSQSYTNLAETFFYLGDVNSARFFIDRAVEIRRAELEDDHPHLNRALAWQEAVYRRLMGSV
ncbi:MAG: tetratricopeptide repeat protein, partial [Marinoscillum sp.]